MHKLPLSCFLALVLSALPGRGEQPVRPQDPPPKPKVEDTAGWAKADFAGGPFWALEAALEEIPGVHAVVTGYLGGTDTMPNYAKVIEGEGGHCLAVEVYYDAKKVRYGKLADAYWRQVDPLTLNRQFNDSGPQFRTALFWRDSVQKKEAEASLDKVRKSGRFKRSIAAVVEPFPGRFHPAEEGQQDYSKKNIRRYEAWLHFSGRKAALDSLWGTGAKGKARRKGPY